MNKLLFVALVALCVPALGDGCGQGEYEDPGGGCVPCADTFAGCTACTLDECTDCNTQICCNDIGKVFDGEPATCHSCDAGYYADTTQNQCVACPSTLNCATCTNGTKCATCETNYKIDDVSGACVLDCASIHGDGCTACTEDDCTDCNTQECCNGIGKIFDGEPATCHDCEDGFYADTTQNQCVACLSTLNCATCTNGTKCATCETNYEINDDGACVLDCAYAYGDGCTDCTVDECTDCSGQECCNNMGKIFDGEPATCHECNAGSYADVDNNQCVSCPIELKCVTCTNGDSCATCANDSIVDSRGYCVLNCAKLYGDGCTSCNETQCGVCNGEDCCTKMKKAWKDNACVEKTDDEEDEGGLDLWIYIVIGVAGVVVAGLLIFGLICLGRKCYKEKGPSVGVATSSHDVLFDDDDDIDLTPVKKNNKKNADDDAFI